MITKEAIEALREAYSKYGQTGDLRTTPPSFECAEAILTAAFAAMPGPAVKVEALGKEFEEAIFSDVETLYEATTLTPAPDLAAENERLRKALEMVAHVAGNIPDDILCRATGANDARYRGGLVCSARDIARAALERT